MDLGPIIFDLSGIQLNKEDRKLLAHPQTGGVILFSRNYDSLQQLVELVSEIRQVRPNALIMVDQEGGRVQRFKEGFTRLPALGLLGQLLDSKQLHSDEILEFSCQLGFLMATEIKATGLDFSLAPVVDLNKGLNEVIGERAFHKNPDIIIELARAYILGMEKAGMISTIKHYPGHGSVTADSHLALPIDDRPLEEIAEDMKPFAALVREPNVRAVLPAHIIYEKVDDQPACFSSYWLQDVLRNQFNFNGAIISDDLSMNAAHVIGDYLQRVNRALSAGCDLVLICNNREGVHEVLKDFEYEMDTTSQQRIQDLCCAEACHVGDLKNDPLWRQAKEGLKRFEGMCATLNPTIV